MDALKLDQPKNFGIIRLPTDPPIGIYALVGSGIILVGGWLLSD